MEDILAVYARPLDPRAPAGLFRRSGQGAQGPHPLAAAGRAGPGRRARTATTRAPAAAICFWPVPRTWAGARSRVTAQRTAIDFAHALRELVDRQFPARRAHRAGDGQPQHPHPGRALPGLPAGRGPAHPGADRVALHPHAWLLAQHGRAGSGRCWPASVWRGASPTKPRWSPRSPPGWRPRNAERLTHRLALHQGGTRAPACLGSIPVTNRSPSPCRCTEPAGEESWLPRADATHDEIPRSSE